MVHDGLLGKHTVRQGRAGRAIQPEAPSKKNGK